MIIDVYKNILTVSIKEIYRSILQFLTKKLKFPYNNGRPVYYVLWKGIL